MDWQDGLDFTYANPGQRCRATTARRVIPGAAFLPGSLCKYVSTDLQTWMDGGTVGPTAAGASQLGIAGVVEIDWPGFSGADPIVTTSSGVAGGQSFPVLRGSQFVKLCTYGYHPGVLVDQSAGTTLTHGVRLTSSANSAGYAQGVPTTGGTGPPVLGSSFGFAQLPAAGIGSSLTQAALVQAVQAFTITGTPVAGDSASITIQSPYQGTPFNIPLNTAGVVQTTTWTLPAITAAQAASVTTMAAAFVAYLNLQANFSKYYTATNAAGVISVTVNATANPFFVTWANGAAAYFSVSGMFVNVLTTTAAYVPGPNYNNGQITSAMAATFGAATAGTGYKGLVPAFICGIL